MTKKPSKSKENSFAEGSEPSLTILENLNEGYYEINKEWKYTYVNKQGELLANKSKEELLGKKVQDVFPDAQVLLFGKIAKQVMKDGKQRSFEAFYPAFNKWFRNTIYSLPIGIGIIASDITRTKTAEKEMEQAVALINTSNDAIITKSVDGTITGWNKAAQRIYGYTAEEIIGKPVSILMPPNKKDDFPKIMQQILAGKRIDHYETQRITKDKKIIDVSISVSAIHDDQGNIIGASKIARDITKQKSLETALRNSEERLKLALGVGKIGVWDWEIETNRIMWTEEVYTIYDVDKVTFNPNKIKVQAFLHPEDRQQVEKSTKIALEKQTGFTLEFKIITLTGRIKWLVSHAFVSRSISGKVIRVVGAIMDITKQKETEQNKNDFISMATHELKTPVTSLKAYAEVLQRKFTRSGDELSAGHLMKMNIQLDKLTNLISDLLDATKVEAGKLQMECQTFLFDELVTEITEELQRTTEKHTLTLKGNTDKKINADRERIGQVITNLISNAIKYSPQSSKIMIISSANTTSITLCVQDFGVGIPQQNQKHVFERFYRVSGSKEKKFPGMGLGLYISSEIIKRHGGKIWVESEEGKGSSFYFKLPLVNKTQ